MKQNLNNVQMLLSELTISNWICLVLECFNTALFFIKKFDHEQNYHSDFYMSNIIIYFGAVGG